MILHHILKCLKLSLHMSHSLKLKSFAQTDRGELRYREPCNISNIPNRESGTQGLAFIDNWCYDLRQRTIHMESSSIFYDFGIVSKCGDPPLNIFIGLLEVSRTFRRINFETCLLLQIK